jgi:hypothetical protein
MPQVIENTVKGAVDGPLEHNGPRIVGMLPNYFSYSMWRPSANTLPWDLRSSSRSPSTDGEILGIGHVFNPISRRENDCPIFFVLMQPLQDPSSLPLLERSSYTHPLSKTLVVLQPVSIQIVFASTMRYRAYLQ